MLVFGSSIGEGNYTRPQGEIVWLEKYIGSTTIAGGPFSDTSATTINVEADTNGKIPKGAKALWLYAHANDSASSGSTCFIYTQASDDTSAGVICRPNGRTNDQVEQASGWQPCNSAGDIQYVVEATGSNTLDSNLYYKGVELR
jgi:hypothetical protein